MTKNDIYINLIERKNKIGKIGIIDFLIERELKKSNITYKINYSSYKCIEIENVVDIEKYKKPPVNFPKNIKLPPIEGLANDYGYLEKDLINDPINSGIKVSVIVLTFNRTKTLSKTLAGIVSQNYPINQIEVIVTDDGGTEDTLKVIKEFSSYINIKYVWHKDIGFTPAIARNNAIKLAANDLIILLDVDMFPSKNLVSSYVRYAKILSKSMLVGPRKYIDINNINYTDILKDVDIENKFLEIVTNNDVANRIKGMKSIDWRLEIFEKTENLKKEPTPFRCVASGNLAFSKAIFNKLGGFDERFNSWGYEDTELGFRFFNDGKYIIPVLNALAYHQEPYGGKNETDRVAGKKISGELFGQLCPYYRKLTSRKENFESPTVSIYIPAYNAGKTICDAIDSALSQTYKDLEVCICDDGSTDETPILLNKYFSSHPRVRWLRQSNGGIGKASNAATLMARGIYIGQLDSDDYLATDVVERCVAEMSNNIEIGLVYTSFENEYADGRLEPGYNYPIYNREKLLTAMIVHHFRLFRRLYWARTSGFDEKIKNAVDYDMYLKISEVCKVKHLNVRGYRRRIHGSNTSIVNFTEQMKNSEVVINKSMLRLGIDYTAQLITDSDSKMNFIQNKYN